MAGCCDGAVEEVSAVALPLERTTEHLIHDRAKFRGGQIVYVVLSRDETEMGFAFPKNERDALVAGEPDKCHLRRTRHHYGNVLPDRPP